MVKPLAVLCAAILATAGCGAGDAGGSPPPPDASPQETAAVEPSPKQTALECGAAFTPPTGGGLYLSGKFPAKVAVAAGTLTGTVQVNTPQAVRGVVAPRADAFLVRDGRIATVPMPQDSVGAQLDLKPSEARELPADVPLASCPTLPPGTYQLYARVVFTPDNGQTAETFGGPWPIEVT